MSTLTIRSRTAALVATGVVAGGVGGVALAQLGTASADSPTPRPAARSADVPARADAPARADVPRGRVLHAEATVRDRAGHDHVVETQNGTISGLDATTLTVKSPDGFTATYTVGKSTRIMLHGTQGTLSTLGTGDRVHVTAVKAGGELTARTVLDGVPPRPRAGMLAHHGWRPMQPPAPDGGATATG